MIDIKTFTSDATNDAVISNTQIYKARNLLTTQETSLDYAPGFGIDINFFITSDFEVQAEAFNAYVLQKITANFIDLKDVMPASDKFSLIYNYVMEKK